MIIAKELLSTSLIPLKITDTGITALHWFDEFRVSHLPVIDGDKFVGIIAEDELFTETYFEEPIHTIPIKLHPISIYDTGHIYEALQLITHNKLSLLPVVNSESEYLGVITENIILENLSEYVGINNPGGIIVLEIAHNDYSLSEIARIIEDNDSKIINLSLTSTANNLLELTLKINRMDVSSIVKSLIRYDYNIVATFSESESFKNIRERYDLLMRYLNV